MPVVINGTTGVTTPGLDASGTNKFATTIGVGGATPAASGAGITFPATQSASTDANTLDDYEEGTWNPVLTYSTTLTNTSPSTTKSLGAGRGSYIKIGKMVYFTVGLFYSDVGVEFISSSISLPFQADSTTDGVGSVNAYYMKARYNTTSPTNLTSNSQIVSSGTAVTTVWSAYSDGGSYSWFTSLTYAYWSGCYRAAS